MRTPGSAVRRRIRALEELTALEGGSGGSFPSPVVPNPSWLVPDWYVNPVTGSDSNSGTSPASALKTIMGGIVPRWGAINPRIKQNTTIHLLDAETLSQEDVTITPLICEGAWFAIVGTPKLVATFTLGVVTAKNRATGQVLTSTGFVAAGIAVGNLVVNATRGNSEAMIQALGGGTATLSQPLSPLTPAADASNFPSPGFVTEVDTWVTGDTVHVYSLPLLNLKDFQCVGGDTMASLIGGVSWAQYIYIPDISGSAGNSYYPAGQTQGCINYYVSCRIDPYVTFSGTEGGGVTGGYLIGCGLGGGTTMSNSSFIGGYANLFGVAMNEGACIDGDALVIDIGAFSGVNYVGLAYVSATGMTVSNGATLKLDAIWYASAILWGQASLQVNDDSVFINKSGTSWVTAVLVSGGLTLNGNAAGSTPTVRGTFTLNGVTEVDVANALIPPNTTVAWCLKTVGTTPGTQSPYFDKAQIAGHFYIKSPTAGANDVYNYAVLPTPLTVTQANLDAYLSLVDEVTGARFASNA